MTKVKQQRIFAIGERLRVSKRSRVVDKERLQEGAAAAGVPVQLPPLEVDVTGQVGEVCGQAYENPQRGEVLVPIRLPNEAVIAVPEDRLERAEAPPPPSVQRAEERIVTGDNGGLGAVSPATIEFWRNYFANEAKARMFEEIESQSKG